LDFIDWNLFDILFLIEIWDFLFCFHFSGLKTQALRGRYVEHHLHLRKAAFTVRVPQSTFTY